MVNTFSICLFFLFLKIYINFQKCCPKIFYLHKKPLLCIHYCCVMVHKIFKTNIFYVKSKNLQLKKRPGRTGCFYYSQRKVLVLRVSCFVIWQKKKCVLETGEYSVALTTGTQKLYFFYKNLMMVTEHLGYVVSHSFVP